MNAARLGLVVRRLPGCSRLPTTGTVTMSTESSGKFDSLAKVPPPRRSGVEASMRKGTGGRSSFSGMVVTVFGSTGFTGRYVVNRLGKRGAQIILPYRGDPYHVKDLKLAGDLGQVLFQPFHLQDEESVRRAMKHSNVVINLIGNTVETKRFPFEEVHVRRAGMIARLARECGVSKLIHMSAMNATLHPEERLIPGGSKFLRTKAEGELAVRDEFPSAIIMRPSNIYGVEDHFLNVYMNPWRRYWFHTIDLYHGGNYTYMMPIFASDVATAIINAAYDPLADGQTYELVGPYCYKIGDMLDWMFSYCNRGREATQYKRMPLGPWTTYRTNLNEFWQGLWRGRYNNWNWEFIERVEATSDVLTGLPTSEDLGLTQMFDFEKQARDTLQLYDLYGYYTKTLGEFPEPPPLKRRPPLRVHGMTMGSPGYRGAAQAFG